ncbi:response regulator [Polaromonas glacialis]|uniref:response regulator n=1 Tax=Polaromonas glacialis TaxID=866564 RepID=UPI00049567AE|nr:response regulator [Polaromonas glacialis]
MNDSQPVTQDSFRRILSRNISFPLGLGALSAVLFLVLIAYLLSILNWVEHSERVIGNANQVARLNSEMESSMRGYLVTGEEPFLEPYEVALSRFDSEVATLSAMVSDNPVQVARLQRITGLQQQWNEFAKEAITLRRNNLDYVALARTSRGKRLKDEIRQELDSFIAMEQRLLLQRNEEARSTTFWSVLAYLLFTLGVSGLLAFRGRRELLGLSVSYDEVLKQQADHAAQLQQQAWLRSGQTRLAEQMLGQPDMARLGHSALEFLAHYLEAPVAALYSRDSDGRLKRVAAHGFTPGSEQVEQTFYGTQGLVGQAALENRIVRLDDVPPDYLKVASGLGQAAPRHVLVVPLHHDAQVTGVVEMAFFRGLQPRDMELTGLVAHTIGTALHGAVYRQRLQDALGETQQLNEELQVQQEELRTANEELQEQSNVLSQSQATLENQQAELEQTNEQLAEQAMSLDHNNAALRQAQADLEARAEELARASRYKSEFLANMSHELRTPLNSSLILARLLSENPKGNLTDEQVRFARAIHSSGNDLLNLINDILDISKVEAGKLELVPEQVTLAALVDSLKTSFEPLARQKNLVFEIHIAPGTPAALLTDRQRVEQILKNLLSNALKFTETGAVRLQVVPEAAGGIALAVQDSGIGIGQEQQDIIFEAFRQADGTTSRRYGGTGLGLSISRDLSILLGGSISVHSIPGQGSTFTLHLPAALPAPLDKPATAALQHAVQPAPQATTAPVPPVSSQSALPAFADDRFMKGKGRVVLVIEDDAVFARILYDLARELGFNCLVAHSGEDGFLLAGQFKPDAVLLDMGLPDRSGLSVLQRLKETPATRHIPVHVVSGQDHREAALLLGAVGYAIKPSSREQLKEVFTTLEHKLTQKLKRVLLVEDDELQRESVMRLIADDEVDITAVQTGAEALALLASTIFDCMIVDLKLPDMQGNELLRRMSAGDICSFPPVIVYTGRSLSRAEEADLLKYSRSIIIKGAHSPERLLDEVTLFLHKVESSLSAEQQQLLKTARSRDEVFEGRKILLVDDDVRNIFSLTSALEQKGFVVEIGRNGFEALERLGEVPDIELVLMDIMMPGMDGLEATRRIRQNPRLQKLPIIAVTAKAMKDDQEQCLAAGANDYLAKPIDLDRLFSLLRVWMPVAGRA